MTSHQTLSLLACQIEIPSTTTAGARDIHLEKTAQKVCDQLQNRRADLVVLPELSSIDYSRAAFDHLDDISEPLDGKSFQTWANVATKFNTSVCYSFARKGAAGTYIAIAVVWPDGTLAGYYDKLHLCQYGTSMEKDYFTAGDHLFTFKINGFTMSPIICYDIRFPELTRRLVLHYGVDVILHCGAYFRDPSFPTWHAFATTRALENQTFLLSLNRAGADYGASVFCYPWMDENLAPQLFANHAEEFRHIEIDRHHQIEAHRTYTFLQDRLDTYERPCKVQD